MSWNIPVFDSTGKIKDARTGLIKTVSGTTSLNILSATGVVTDGTQATKRWNPGHYIRPQGNPMLTDQNSYWSNQLSHLQGNGQDIPELMGWFGGIAWGAFETAQGVFDYSRIDVMIEAAAAQGQRIMVMLTPKSFGSSSNGLEAPPDLSAQIFETGSGFIAATWRDGTGGHPDVGGRLITAFEAMATRYDDNDAFEAILTVESTPSFGGTPDPPGVPDDYSTEVMRIAWERLYVAMEAAFPKTNVVPQINSLSQKLSSLHEKIYDLRISIGGPDAREVPAWDFFAGRTAAGETPVRNYRTQLGRFITVSQSAFDARTAAQIIDLMQSDQDVTHAMWVDTDFGPGKDWSDTKTAIQADPLLHIACPTRYLSCTFIPPSQPITGISFSFGTLINTAPGNSVNANDSDNWPITWAWNGHQYTSFGDGEGFRNLSGEQTTRASIGVSRIEGSNSNYSAYDVFKSGKAMPDSHTGKCYGMLGANAKLYMAWDYRILESVDNGGGSRFDRYEESTICSSSDGGASWTEEIRWNGSDWGNDLNGFYGMSFVNYGQDHGGARSPKTFNSYIYMTICEHANLTYDCQIPGGIGLMRVLESNIESGNKSDWEYLSAIDGNNDPSWSTTLTDRINHFQDSQDGNDVASISFNEPLGRYLLTMFHNQRDTGPQSTDCLIGIYEAPEPWGPWTTVLKTNVETLGLADGPNVIFWNFSNKWLSSDGLSFTMVGTLLGKDEWGTIEGTFTV